MRLALLHHLALKRSLFLAVMCVGCLDLPPPTQSLQPLDGYNLSDTSLEMAADMQPPTDLSQRSDAAEPDSGALHADAQSGQDAGTNDRYVDMRTDDASAVCGNGVVEAGEECEPAGNNASCSDQCLLIECGNGRVDSGEVCDDGNQNDFDYCILQCQVQFPEQWAEVLTDPTLTNETDLYHSVCAINLPAFVDPTIPHRDVIDGRYAYAMWAVEHYHWIALNRTLDEPTRISVNIYVPEGFNRKLKVTLTQNLAFSDIGDPDSCGRQGNGPFIEHEDFSNATSRTDVRIRGGYEPNGRLFEMPDSGQSDTWVSVAFELHPSSGVVRFYYDNRVIQQAQYDLQQSIIGIRFSGEYAQDAQVFGAMGIEGLTIEVGAP